MGGFRDINGIEVMVKKSMFRNTFEKVKRAFADHPEFTISEETDTDAIRAIYNPSDVGVDIMIR